jgi:hypothetical protein
MGWRALEVDFRTLGTSQILVERPEFNRFLTPRGTIQVEVPKASTPF